MNPSLRLIPVIDIQHGVVVRGVGGRRSEYRPIVSCLTDSTEPFVVAQALLHAFAPTEIYIADLDSISGDTAVAEWRRRLRELTVKIWLDAGIRDAGEVGPLMRVDIDSIILGLETIDGPEALDALVGRYGADRFVFSLDQKGGRLLGNWQRWPAANERDWSKLVDRVVASGIRRLILLDLQRVGEGDGVGTEEMCRAIAERYPDLEIICGGGVRNVNDLRTLQGSGAAGALVASALHDRRIKPGDWPSSAPHPSSPNRASSGCA